MFTLKNMFTPLFFLLLYGTFFHYVYDAIGSNLIINMFVPINESVWEHMKMLFYPSLAFFLLNYMDNTGSTYIVSYVTGVTFSIVFCIVSYYIYDRFFPGISEVLNIVFYYISFASIFGIMYVMNYVLEPLSDDFNFICEIILISYVCIFCFYTYLPPNLDLFLDKSRV
ncbi:MAG: DUF6512 family protein [Clostridia bacterium]